MEDIKAGHIVKCFNNKVSLDDLKPDITIGRYYSVIKVSGEYLYIEDDMGDKWWYINTFFWSIVDNRNKVIDKILK